jgi:purine nucleosidase
MSTSGRTKLLMDVDTGVDDAMALALAVASPEIELVGVTTVAGNVDRDQATSNTLRVLDFVGADDVPVYAGMTRPLARVRIDATHFHGHDGIGNAPLPDTRRGIERQSAPDVIIQTARELAGELTLLFVGPLTNLAVALGLEPELPSLVRRTVIMGGAFTVPGNETPWAEFNVAADPEAARVVAESALNATWIGLDVTHQTELLRSDWEQLGDDDSPNATLVREVCRSSFESRNLDSVYLHDPLAVGVVLKPQLVECRQSSIWIDTSVRETAGTTRMVMDALAPEHQVATKVDSESFRQLFGEILELPVRQRSKSRNV